MNSNIDEQDAIAEVFEAASSVPHAINATQMHTRIHRLNRALLAVYAAIPGERGYYLSALRQILLVVANCISPVRADNLWTLVHLGLVQHLLAMPATAKEYPEFMEPWTLESALKQAASIRRYLHRELEAWHGGELYAAAFEEFLRGLESGVRQRHRALYARQKARCAVYKEELVMRALSPKRVEAWIAAGLDVEEA